MDYKIVIKNQEIRFKVLYFLKFISDNLMIKLQYRIKMDRKLNFKNLQRYSEKLQWYKLNYRTRLMTQCSDKYTVREYIKSKGLENILVTLFAVYESASQINFDLFPEKFVVKTTNGSGTNYFCKDKSILLSDTVKQLLRTWLKRDVFSLGREWSYKNIAPRIIIEEYLEDDVNSFEGINDYKFICLNGEVKYIVLDIDRYTNHKRNIYDKDWNFIDVKTDHPNFGDCVSRPIGLDEMLKVSNIIAKDFPIVRVDLYWVKGKVYFGELTFYPWSGYIQFDPDNFDFVLGQQTILPESLIE